MCHAEKRGESLVIPRTSRKKNYKSLLIIDRLFEWDIQYDQIVLLHRATEIICPLIATN